jgi:hypothetical protein
MAKFKPTVATQELIDVLAHILIMSDLDKNCPGCKGMLDAYLNKTLTQRQRAIFEAFQAHTKKVRKRLAELMEQDKDNEGT